MVSKAPSIEIRPLSPVDFVTYTALAMDAYRFHRKHEPRLIRDPSTFGLPPKKFSKALRDPGHLLVGIEWEGKIRAFIHARFFPSRGRGDQRTLKLVSIGLVTVAVRFRRRGLGTALFKYAMEWAHRKGARMIGLGVWEFNEAALNLYEKLGLTVAQRTMVKQIRP